MWGSEKPSLNNAETGPQTRTIEDRELLRAVRADRAKALWGLVEGTVDNLTKKPSRALALALALAAEAPYAASAESGIPTQLSNYFEFNTSLYPEAYTGYFEALNASANSAEYMANLQRIFSGANDQTKMILLGMVGATLDNAYNYDMFRKLSTHEMSNDEMFQVLKTGVTGGMCGNAAEFMKEIGNTIGLPTVTVSASLPDVTGVVGNGAYVDHVLNMVKVEVPQEDGSYQMEYGIVDWGSLALTGATTLSQAMGVNEQVSGIAPSVQSQYVAGQDKHNVVPEKSPANVSLGEVTHTDKTARQLLEAQPTSPESQGFALRFDAQKGLEDITLTKDHVHLSFDHFTNPGDPYNTVTEATGATIAVDHGVPDGQAGLSEQFSVYLTEAQLNTISTAAAEYAGFQAVFKADSGERTVSSSELGKLTVDNAAMIRASAGLLLSTPNGVGLIGRAPAGEAELADQTTVHFYFSPNDPDNIYLTFGVQGNVVPESLDHLVPTLHAGTYWKVGLTRGPFQGSVGNYSDGYRKDTTASVGLSLNPENKAALSASYEDRVDFPGDPHQKTWSVGGSYHFGYKNNDIVELSINNDKTVAFSLKMNF